jgi:hypothetical protein
MLRRPSSWALSVMPAQAGIQLSFFQSTDWKRIWIPALAGMTLVQGPFQQPLGGRHG